MTCSDLRRVRHELHLTQAELAAKLGCSRNTITRWEMKSGSYPVSQMAANLVQLLARKKDTVAGDPLKPAEMNR
jgi:DNA-binding transcriptional regulator YiaG